MHALFTTVQRSLPAFFSSLPADAVRDCCSPSDYSHGKDYFLFLTTSLPNDLFTKSRLRGR